MSILRLKAYATAIAVCSALIVLPDHASAAQCKLKNTDILIENIMQSDSNSYQAFIDQTLKLRAAGTRTIYDLKIKNQLMDSIDWELKLLHIKASKKELTYYQTTKRLRNIVSAFCNIKNEQLSLARTNSSKIMTYAKNIKNIDRTINNAIAVLFYQKYYLAHTRRMNLASSH